MEHLDRLSWLKTDPREAWLEVRTLGFAQQAPEIGLIIVTLLCPAGLGNCFSNCVASMLHRPQKSSKRALIG